MLFPLMGSELTLPIQPSVNESGSIIRWGYLSLWNDNTSFEIRGNGLVLNTFSGSQTNGVFEAPLPILQEGDYVFSIHPVVNATSTRFVDGNESGVSLLIAWKEPDLDVVKTEVTCNNASSITVFPPNKEAVFQNLETGYHQFGITHYDEAGNASNTISKVLYFRKPPSANPSPIISGSGHTLNLNFPNVLANGESWCVYSDFDSQINALSSWIISENPLIETTSNTASFVFPTNIDRVRLQFSVKNGHDQESLDYIMKEVFFPITPILPVNEVLPAPFNLMGTPTPNGHVRLVWSYNQPSMNGTLEFVLFVDGIETSTLPGNLRTINIGPFFSNTEFYLKAQVSSSYDTIRSKASNIILVAPDSTPPSDPQDVYGAQS